MLHRIKCPINRNIDRPLHSVEIMLQIEVYLYLNGLFSSPSVFRGHRVGQLILTGLIPVDLFFIGSHFCDRIVTCHTRHNIRMFTLNGRKVFYPRDMAQDFLLGSLCFRLLCRILFLFCLLSGFLLCFLSSFLLRGFIGGLLIRQALILPARVGAVLLIHFSFVLRSIIRFTAVKFSVGFENTFQILAFDILTACDN